MSDQTIFNQGQPPTSGDQNNQNSNPNNGAAFQDLLSLITNEAGEPKYKTVKDALVALQHSQSFISTLKNEKTELESKLNEASSIAAKVTELESVLARITSAPPPPPASPPAESNVDVQGLVKQVLTQEKEAERANANISSVTTTLQQQFGDKAEEVFYTRAQEAGLSKAEINALAAKSPAAALRIIGVQSTKPNKVSQGSSINTTNLEPNTQTFIGRNTERLEVGATAHEMNKASQRAKAMVDELHSQGKEIRDLTDPKIYFKYFGQ